VRLAVPASVGLAAPVLVRLVVPAVVRLAVVGCGDDGDIGFGLVTLVVLAAGPAGGFGEAVDASDA
jgi:hypothetical protein